MERRTVTTATSYLRAVADSLGDELRGLVELVVGDPVFQAAAAAEKWHHAYAGGLAVHTAEVVEYALGLAEGKQVDLKVLVVAAIFHDREKINDYVFVEVSNKNPKGIGYVAGYTGSGHILRGNNYWLEVSRGLSLKFRLEVGHAILAHHGKVEWGSPFTPQTLEAKLLHEADMLSANEGPGADRWDGRK